VKHSNPYSHSARVDAGVYWQMASSCGPGAAWPKVISIQAQDMTDAIEALALRFEAACAELIGNRTVGLLADFPNYSNVGDSAIYLGELEMLRRIHRFHHTIDMFDFEDWKDGAVSPPRRQEAILINGGGNFGDLYPDHQELRLAIIRRYRDTRIIQLPQSIHFQSLHAVEATARCIDGHKDFHLMVRDRASLSFAEQHFQCNIVLAPDAAFSLRGLQKVGPATIDRLRLLRTDSERVIATVPLGDFESEEDWIMEPYTWLFACDRELKNIARRFPSVYRRFGSIRTLRQLLYMRMARQRLDRGIRQLSRARSVTTDRLHAFVLCRLLGIDVEARDNSYGKISAFRAAWGI